MFGTLKGRILVIVAVLAAAGGFYYKNNGLKLGLDLQGGMHLALEVEDLDGTMTPAARADATDRALKIIRTRIDQFGVEEPLIQKAGTDRIIVELPGVRDEKRAKDIIQQTAFLEFQLVTSARDLVDALPRIDRAIVNAVGPEGVTAAPQGEQSSQALRDLLFKGDSANASADSSAAAAEPTNRPLSALLLEGSGDGEFMVEKQNVETVSRYLALPEVQRLMPRGTVLRWGVPGEDLTSGTNTYRRLYLLQEKPFMTGEMLEDAQAGRDPQFHQSIVSFQLDRKGGRLFEKTTGAHINERIAIVLDKEVYSAPVVRSQIGARGQIELGNASLQEANDLALVLRAGALPAPLKVVEERVVGPTLGADAIAQGKIAGLVGIVLVIGIMVSYYRMAGFLSIVGLVAYIGVVLGGLAFFHATLTAPGIAGLILSIGMAVDANVLIYERMREELAHGRTFRIAVDEGFNHAMSAIIDTHLTTLITSLILFQFGTGPVRGFAVTLSIGIIASFFSAVYVTRTLFLLIMQKKGAVGGISI
jgi:preprotein translocase subunit SecD